MDPTRRRLDAFDLLDQPVLLIGSDYRIVDANPAAAALMGVGRERLVGRTCHEAHHGLDAPCWAVQEVECPVRAVLQGRSRAHVIHRHVHGDRVVFEEVVATPLRAPDGTLDVVVEEVRDVTEVIRTKEISQYLRDELKVLYGVVPICATCKRIRDAEGHWQPVETYVHDRSDAEFTHGWCPECAEEAIAEARGRRPGASPR